MSFARVAFSAAFRPVRFLVALVLFARVLLPAQTPPPGGTDPAGGARGGGRGAFNRPPNPPDDDAGFVPIFDGRSLAGWEGDPVFWRAEGGAIVGESTPDNVVKENSFLIWRGGTVRNFELKLEFRLNNTNSGVQYRSVELPDVGRWILKGYQADLDFINQHTGNIHDERGRAFLSRRGKFTRAIAGGFKEIGAIGDPDALKGMVKINDWNTYHIIARNEVLIHVLNGQVMAVLIDEDPARQLEGVLGFQMHVGPPFKVEYRNIRLRTL